MISMRAAALAALLLVGAATAGPNQPPQQATPMLSQQTIQTLQLFPKHLVAVVVCTGYEFKDQGTRSERVVISARGIAGVEGPIQLTRYTQGDPLMKASQTYLIAAYDDGEWAPAFSLVEWHPVSTGDANEALTRAQAQLR